MLYFDYGVYESLACIVSLRITSYLMSTYRCLFFFDLIQLGRDSFSKGQVHTIKCKVATASLKSPIEELEIELECVIYAFGIVVGRLDHFLLCVVCCVFD